MPALVIDLAPSEEQTKFNHRRWKEICADPIWEKWQGRVETDRNGTVLMSPPANFNHSNYASKIFELLLRLMKDGRPYAECAISTALGVRSADVAWMSTKRKKALREVCLTGAPEICVEVLSPSNRRRAIAEKKTLYFAAGAIEVWYCDGKGKMTFFTDAVSKGVDRSRFCPEFPRQIDGD
jgi:Uma2 family endonuclease